MAHRGNGTGAEGGCVATYAVSSRLCQAHHWRRVKGLREIPTTVARLRCPTDPGIVYQLQLVAILSDVAEDSANRVCASLSAWIKINGHIKNGPPAGRPVLKLSDCLH